MFSREGILPIGIISKPVAQKIPRTSINLEIFHMGHAEAFLGIYISWIDAGV